MKVVTNGGCGSLCGDTKQKRRHMEEKKKKIHFLLFHVNTY